MTDLPGEILVKIPDETMQEIRGLAARLTIAEELPGILLEMLKILLVCIPDGRWDPEGRYSEKRTIYELRDKIKELMFAETEVKP